MSDERAEYRDELARSLSHLALIFRAALELDRAELVEGIETLAPEIAEASAEAFAWWEAEGSEGWRELQTERAKAKAKR